MSDFVVETPSFEEDLMNNRVIMLNQNGVNRVIEIIKEKDKEIERLKLIIVTAIRIYEKCEETQDYSTCDLDMYEVLKGVHNDR